MISRRRRDELGHVLASSDSTERALGLESKCPDFIQDINAGQGVLQLQNDTMSHLSVTISAC